MKKKNYPTIERSFVMLKPDSVVRGLVGKIFQRFEEQGLKLVAGRMIMATIDQVDKHYPKDNDKWLAGIGAKSCKNFDDDEKKIIEAYGTIDHKEIGMKVFEAMKVYLTKSPVIITVWEGNHAIKRVRKVVGSTVPTFAEVGSIRGDMAFDTPALAIKSGRVAFTNLIHASDSLDESKREIEIWFGKKYKDLSDYERIDYIDMY